jgi:hypothetical protein
MSVWKFRVVVYGMLAVVAALVLWQANAQGGDTPPPRHHRTLTVYSGHTNGGVPLTLSFNGPRLYSVSLRGLGRSCDGRYFFGWSPAVGQGDVRLNESADGGFRVDERWMPEEAPGWTIDGYMEGTRTDAHVIGVLRYEASRGGTRCHSDLVEFQAE